MHLSVKQWLELTLRVLFRVMHGEEQREGGAHCLFTAATQAAVLYFTSKQLSDGRLTRGAQSTVIRHSIDTNRERL